MKLSSFSIYVYSKTDIRKQFFTLVIRGLKTFETMQTIEWAKTQWIIMETLGADIGTLQRLRSTRVEPLVGKYMSKQIDKTIK